ncbi:unnamed protein product [Parascedosporium putredinis]|uniref:Helicase C-terminal domain-containing protein n=1 Tax=Parascedosporium putredinis TaxID=1442378 RepID=A0A9P1H5W6_9PEZI|nr:unnamed protein product [Parascedosporium putredinis]CAI7996887.1 unnamed protein product [Parascedosporium putredinis]
MIKSSTSKESKRFPVKLQISPASLKLEIVHIDQKTIVGLSNLGSTKVSAFNDAIQTYGVVLTATAVFPAKFRHSYVPCALRIIVYGCMASHQAVAETLGLRGLYLQHPISLSTMIVCHTSTHNISFALAGRCPLGGPEDLGQRLHRVRERPDRARKAHIARDFRLRTWSRFDTWHQITALAMMIEKECNVTDNLAFPALWELKTNGNGLKRHVQAGRISVLTYHGNQRHHTTQAWGHSDVVLTTYGVNRLDDIGALVSFIQVDGLHSQKDFNRLIASPIKNKKSYGLDRLRSLVKAICLRRTKDSVQNLVRLPQKEERDMVLSLTGEEKKLYEFFRVRAARAYDEMQKLKARRAVSKAQKQPSAGGTKSVNLTAANFVHILEPQWNPMVEAQAVDRVHRIGQERDVVITRYLIKDSVEFVRTPRTN